MFLLVLKPTINFYSTSSFSLISRNVLILSLKLQLLLLNKCLLSMYFVQDMMLHAWETPRNKTDIFPVLLATEIVKIHLVVQESRSYQDSSRILCSTGVQTCQELGISPCFTISFLCCCFYSLDINQCFPSQPG